MGRTPLAALLATLAVAAAVPADAGARPFSHRTTFLLSRALDGGFANGPSRNAAVSRDQRFARWMAFLRYLGPE